MEVNRATISSGSVGTFRSHTTLPVSSTTHTAVSFTETSRPTKYVIAIAPSSLLEVTVTPIWSSHVEGLRSTYSATQPPRYTIFPHRASHSCRSGFGQSQLFRARTYPTVA